MTYNIYLSGDHAVTIDLGDTIDVEINQKVINTFYYLLEKKIPGVRDIIPAYCSLTIVYDVVAIRKLQKTNYASAFIKKIILDAFENAGPIAEPVRKIEIPVCYDISFAPDLRQLAEQKNLSTDEVIQIHSGKTYRVYMIGFVPGFPYMAAVDEKITMQRREQPRTIVPAGSIGIAGFQTGIYPLNSPAGWNIIGQTPLKLFNATKEKPCFLQLCDEVKFIPITKEEFNEINESPNH